EGRVPWQRDRVGDDHAGRRPPEDRREIPAFRARPGIADDDRWPGRHREERRRGGGPDHFVRSRKFARSCLPSGVMPDSGWNCTPYTGCARWRTPWISLRSSTETATTSSASGSDAGSTTSEWYRITSIGDGRLAKTPLPA